MINNLPGIISIETVNVSDLHSVVILKFNDNKFWLSIADSDVIYWCKGVALSGNFKVEISEPEACPVSLQGPKSKDLMAKATNNDPKVMDLKYYQFVLKYELKLN